MNGYLPDFAIFGNTHCVTGKIMELFSDNPVFASTQWLYKMAKKRAKDLNLELTMNNSSF